VPSNHPNKTEKNQAINPTSSTTPGYPRRRRTHRPRHNLENTTPPPTQSRPVNRSPKLHNPSISANQPIKIEHTIRSTRQHTHLPTGQNKTKTHKTIPANPLPTPIAPSASMHTTSWTTGEPGTTMKLGHLSYQPTKVLIRLSGPALRVRLPDTPPFPWLGRRRD
jgi:hypothetical protein